MTDNPFQSRSLLLVDQNIGNVAQFNKKILKKPHFISVSPSGQKLGHYNYEFSTFQNFCFKNVKVGI